MMENPKINRKSPIYLESNLTRLIFASPFGRGATISRKDALNTFNWALILRQRDHSNTYVAFSIPSTY